ncbi:peptidase s41 family protein [Colletotrichum sojae]|uniref:Peptidase s41 family protein n=1 Tax=Colletotrichum sojae TaxID=2175907 RepID=A0A8H6J5T0_9PEZI|nr:peptidase s41 family protein [Colletotrichum sojae]
MKLSISESGAAALLALAATPLASAADCNADNCLRALRATQTPGRLESARAFCATFTGASAAPTETPAFALDNCKPNQVGDASFRISSACSCIAAPSTTASATVTASASTTATAGAACSAVSASWAAQIAATPTPTVDAKLAYECINSAPLNKPAALKFIDEMKPYLEWQSDLAFLKNPPADYFFPPHDVFAALDKVRAGIEADEYPNEYSWQQDMFINVFGPGHDGHLYVYSDLLTNAMEWARPFALVSISEDGVSTPVIKIYDDVMNTPASASVLKLINGVDAVKFIEDRIFAVTGNQDADAAYNSMFYQKSFAASGGTGFFKQGGRTRYVYPGPLTSFTFENGTEITLPNVARLKGNWTGVVDGPSFFKKFAPNAGSGNREAAPTSTASPTSTPTPSPTPAPAGVSGYPAPVVISSDTIVSGYFLDEPGFEEVAVLVMLSFSPSNPPEFQKVVEDFFAAAVRAGKTKLVVDVQVNGGGYIFQGYDTFRQIFPDIVQEGTGHWRYSPGFKAVSEVFSKNCEGYDPETASAELITQCESVYNWGYDLDRNLSKFTSYPDKFPPNVFEDDQYTDLIQWNFNNPLDTINSTYGIGYDVTGYGSRSNFTRPFGGPENIVILYDGYCASTCTLFSQFMKWDAGVKSIAMGGRPEIQGKIQGVGGVKGSQSYSFSSVYSYAQTALENTDDEALKSQLDRFTGYPIFRASAAGVNVKDEILRENWDDGTPAQFVAEYSDCRLFWEADMHRDITNLWKAAATAAFKGGKCAFGGIEHKETKRAASGGRPVPFNKPRIPVPVKVPSRVPVARREEGEAEKSWTFEANQHMVAEN